MHRLRYKDSDSDSNCDNHEDDQDNVSQSVVYVDTHRHTPQTRCERGNDQDKNEEIIAWQRSIPSRMCRFASSKVVFVAVVGVIVRAIVVVEGRS